MSANECVMTSRRRQKMLVLLLPEGLPLQKTGASATHHFLIFSAIERVGNQL